MKQNTKSFLLAHESFATLPITIFQHTKELPLPSSTVCKVPFQLRPSPSLQAQFHLSTVVRKLGKRMSFHFSQRIPSTGRRIKIWPINTRSFSPFTNRLRHLQKAR